VYGLNRIRRDMRRLHSFVVDSGHETRAVEHWIVGHRRRYMKRAVAGDPRGSVVDVRPRFWRRAGESSSTKRIRFAAGAAVVALSGIPFVAARATRIVEPILIACREPPSAPLTR
jgi:hypothetical protein